MWGLDVVWWVFLYYAIGQYSKKVKRWCFEIPKEEGLVSAGLVCVMLLDLFLCAKAIFLPCSRHYDSLVTLKGER